MPPGSVTFTVATGVAVANAAAAFLASSSDTLVSMFASFSLRTSSSTANPSARSGFGFRICQSV